MKTKVFLGVLALFVLGICVAVFTYSSLDLLNESEQSTVTAPIGNSHTNNMKAGPIGNNIWVTDDHARGVSCYRSAQSGGTLSCVKVK